MKQEANIGLLDIPNEDYHAMREVVGHSGLVRIMRSPAHYQEYIINPPEPTPAKALGKAIHAAILEPDSFRRDYVMFDEALLEGSLQSLDDYKTAAALLGITFDALNKEELKAAIKAADTNSAYQFRDDVQADIAALTHQRMAGSLNSLDDLKQAAEALGIVIAKMKKEDLKAAIREADVESRFAFRDDVQAEIAALTQSRLTGTLQSLDEYKGAAITLGVKFDALNKEELKAAIKAADTNVKFKFREDEIVRLYDDKNILTPEQMQSIAAMCDMVRRHQGAANLLSSGLAELSGFWTDAETGIRCKFRPDWLVVEGSDSITGMADVKSCLDASAEGFSRAVAAYGYDVEAAFYQDGLKAVSGKTVPFFFVAAEKAAPFAVAVYQASEEMIGVGRAKYRAGLQLLAWCRKSNRWPAYQPNGEIEEINLPRWAANFDLED